MPQQNSLVLSADFTPFTSLLELLGIALKFGHERIRGLSISNESVRIESVKSTASGTGELRFAIYPSDAFLLAVAACVAGEAEL